MSAPDLGVVSEGKSWLRGGSRLAVVSLLMGFLHATCVLLLAANAVAVWLGIGGLTASGFARIVHADTPRHIFMVLASLFALSTLYVLWNGWRLRRNPAAAWRRRPLSRREKWHFGVVLGLAIATLALVISEMIEHTILHGTI